MESRTVKVELGSRSYPILIGNELLTCVGKECGRFNFAKKCVVISDRTVAPLYASVVNHSLRQEGFEPVMITVPAGEKTKSLKNVEYCYHLLARHRIERRSFVIALGGGVVGDLAGFVAASYLRGIGFIQIPTTLLAQVDSSVGGKVGVNLPAGKNLVGAFYQPRLVLCDLDTLKTLPPREFRAGLAEVIKYGAIYDAKLFARLERDLPLILQQDGKTLAEVIANCCRIKAEVVSQDETESGLRAILNFGHTIGHAIEAIMGYGKFLHGEAISVGQVMAAKISSSLIGLPMRDAERIEKLFVKAGLPIDIEFSPAQVRKVFNAMRLDKKVDSGQIKFVLLKRMGEAVIGQKIDEKWLRTFLLKPAR